MGRIKEKKIEDDLMYQIQSKIAYYADIDGDELFECAQEITTYIIGEVEKLKKKVSGEFGTNTYHSLTGDEIRYNQALDDVEKMLKGEK